MTSDSLPPIAVGDLFEMEGRRRTIWTVRKLLKVPGSGILVEMSQVEGMGRVTVKLDELFTEILFKKVTSAVL
jgi:hypothetical protein